MRRGIVALAATAALDISIRGRRGDSNTWTGLATPACAILPAP
ncbi:MAG: hypothetical protein ACRDKH_00840 [Solirubrobacterales bacterium]